MAVPNITFKQLADQTYVEIDKNAELEYTFDFTRWCASRNVELASYEIVLPEGSGVEVLSDNRDGDLVTIAVKLEQAAAPVCGRLVDGVTCRVTTSVAPRSGRALIDDRTMWFMTKEK